MTRVEDEVITHFYYTGSALLFTTVNEYVLQTQNILDPAGSIVASKRFEGQAATGQEPYADDYFFYRYDIRGSVTNIVDGEGTVVKSYDYDEFGVTTASGDTFFNEVTFTGSVADASGLLYMNARYYNPATARFLSQDSYTGSASVPWTQHLYAYCNNNPVNMVDPTGHAPRGLTPTVRLPMVSAFDKKKSKKIIETAAKTLSNKEVAQEDNKNPNDYNIKMFNLGLETPVSLQDGQWYFVETLRSIGVGSRSYVEGEAILFNETHYAFYEIKGLSLSKSLLPLPVNEVSTSGVVSNVYQPKDYEGPFLNVAGGVFITGKSFSIWSSVEHGPVTAESKKYQEFFGSLGWSLLHYKTSNSKEWIEGSAPIIWGDTYWDMILSGGVQLDS